MNIGFDSFFSTPCVAGDKAAATMAPPAAMQSGPARKYKEPPKSGTVPTKMHRIRNTFRDGCCGPWILGYKVAK